MDFLVGKHFRPAVDIFHICLGLAIFKVLCFFLEKPTGRLADSIGRKTVTCAGIFFLSVGFFVYSFAEVKALLYASLSIAAIGLTCLNGAKQAWFLNRGNDVVPNFNSQVFFIDLELARRLALIFGAYVGKVANSINYRYPWYLVGFAGALALAIALRTPKAENDSQAVRSAFPKSKLGKYNHIALTLILAANLFMGVEFAVRNIVFAPFAIGLNGGDPSIMATVIIVGSIAGLFGQQAFRYLSVSKPALANPYIFTVIAAFVYGFAEFVAWKTESPTSFVVAFAVAVFTYGWFFSLQEVILHSNIDEKSRAASQSRVKQFSHGATVITLLILSVFIREDNLRNFWPLAFSAQFCCAGFFFALYLVLQRQAQRSSATMMAR